MHRSKKFERIADINIAVMAYNQYLYIFSLLLRHHKTTTPFPLLLCFNETPHSLNILYSFFESKERILSPLSPSITPSVIFSFFLWVCSSFLPGKKNLAAFGAILQFGDRQ